RRQGQIPASSPCRSHVNSDLCQLRNTLNVPECESGDVAKLVLDRSHTLLEPDCGDWVSVAIYGSNTDRNNRLPLGFGQLLIIERDNNNSHTPLSGAPEKTFDSSVPEPPCGFLINCGN